MPESTQTTEEIAGSLTGFDEIAIEKAFGAPPNELGQLRTVRSLIFTHRRREGDNDIQAYNAAMELPITEVGDYFAQESAESGKDNSAPENEPTS